MAEATLFERLKGEAGITTVVSDFYDRVLAGPTLQPVFAHRDTDQLRRHQALFLMHAAGGPTWTMGRSMAEAHTGLGITDAQFGAVAGHLVAALSAAGVPDSDQNAVIGMVGSPKDQVVGH